jgi:hypothetical protein
MGRRYQVSTEGVLVAAAQDLAQIIGASGKILRIRRVHVGATDTTEPTAQQLELRCQFLTGVTNGSGGSSPTPRPFDAGDAAASFTAKANSTTPATGTAVTLEEWGCHIANGWTWVWPDAETPIVGPSESFVFGLLSTVSGTVHLSMSVTVEELGG